MSTKLSVKISSLSPKDNNVTRNSKSAAMSPNTRYSPRTSPSNKVSRRGFGSLSSKDMESSYNNLLHESLVTLMQILLKANVNRTAHDHESISAHIQQRSYSAVNDELRKVIDSLQNFQGPQQSHELTAYAHVTASILRDVERVAVNGEHRQQLSALRDANQSLKNDSIRMHTILTEEMAQKDRKITELETEKEVLTFKNNSLIRTVELLSKELEKATRTNNELQQNNVEFCMQGMDYKAEVDRSAERILDSIQARLGFIPNTINKQVSLLKEIKPPGDANYDKIRALQRSRIKKLKKAKEVVRSGHSDTSISSRQNTATGTDVAVKFKSSASSVSSVATDEFSTLDDGKNLDYLALYEQRKDAAAEQSPRNRQQQDNGRVVTYSITGDILGPSYESEDISESITEISR